MTILLRWWVLLSALAAAAPALAGVTDYPFRLVTRPDGHEQELVAENDGPAPITVYVTVSGENYASDRAWPATIVVPPHTALAVGRVFVADRTAGSYNFLFRYSHHFGRVDALHDAAAVYRLPFPEGESFGVTQAYGGRLTSHNNRENLYAVDFAMPRGTPVVAARAGVVIDATSKYEEGGYDLRYLDQANTVAIVHDDGTVAEYAHLSPGKAVVTLGQPVAAGDLIGHSGNTGYTSGPHLHFIVSRPTVSDGKVARESVPIVFYANEPPVRFSAQPGRAVTANYGAAESAQESRPVSGGEVGAATGLTSHQPHAYDCR